MTFSGHYTLYRMEGGKLIPGNELTANLNLVHVLFFNYDNNFKLCYMYRLKGKMILEREKKLT